jgi:hypothetical protein
MRFLGQASSGSGLRLSSGIQQPENVHLNASILDITRLEITVRDHSDMAMTKYSSGSLNICTHVWMIHIVMEP